MLTDTTRVVGIGLIVVVHVAVIQVHVPGVVRVVRLGSSRPVIVAGVNFSAFLLNLNRSQPWPGTVYHGLYTAKKRQAESQLSF